jgi:TonB-dependent receptor
MPARVKNAELLPITLFEDPNFNYGKFLGGDYTMSVPTNVGLMWQVLNVVKDYAATHNVSESWARNGILSTTNNYSGTENESAAYGMATVNFGPQLSVLPGVRYQVLGTAYTAPRIIEQGVSRNNFVYHDTTIDESHGFWLPMVHLVLKPLTWLQVHLAYTNTITYPDYNTITPRMDVPTSGSTIIWNNYALTPARSTNYDAAINFFDNSIGLISIDGFLKHIDNLIFSTGTRFVIDPAQYPGIPSSSAGSPISTYINDPYAVDVQGLELDWQTHFWYLPGALSGLVLGVNYTHIFSAAKYPYTITTFNYLTFKTVYTDTFYTSRLFDQPYDVANLSAGYDFKGFSIRVSMLYQSDVFKSPYFYKELRENTGEYLRWDLSIKQDLPWSGLQVFFDLNNINGTRDVTLIQGPGYPQAEEDYGMTADMGLRWKI